MCVYLMNDGVDETLTSDITPCIYYTRSISVFLYRRLLQFISRYILYSLCTVFLYCCFSLLISLWMSLCVYAHVLVTNSLACVYLMNDGVDRSITSETRPITYYIALSVFFSIPIIAYLYGLYTPPPQVYPPHATSV